MMDSLRSINTRMNQPRDYQHNNQFQRPPFQPREHRPKTNFYLADNPPKFMFTAQLFIPPTQGEIISIDNSKFKVVEVTRNLEYSADKGFIKEVGINVLVTNHSR